MSRKKAAAPTIEPSMVVPAPTASEAQPVDQSPSVGDLVTQEVAAAVDDTATTQLPSDYERAKALHDSWAADRIANGDSAWDNPKLIHFDNLSDADRAAYFAQVKA